MKYFKKLVGDRIYLSPRSTEDVEKFTEWLNDFRVTDYTGRSANVLTIEGEKEYLQKLFKIQNAYIPRNFIFIKSLFNSIISKSNIGVEPLSKENVVKVSNPKLSPFLKRVSFDEAFPYLNEFSPLLSSSFNKAGVCSYLCTGVSY